MLLADGGFVGERLGRAMVAKAMQTGTPLRRIR
ncbi:hypothetical protein J2Y70_003136 [Xanthomonas translucens]|nr:hypothetical protein [Xanthomonas translucens]